MAITMEDIAQIAGVNRSTVSRALANSPRVKPDTRVRIQQIAREMGYLTNTVARSLTTKRTYNLGVLLLDITEAYVGELVREMDDAARRIGYGLILAHCGYGVQQIQSSLHMLIERRADAIIVSDRVIADIYRPLLDEDHFPVVFLNIREKDHSLVTDNTGAARKGMAYLLDLGHQRIAYIGSPRAKVESNERQRGYEQALRERNLSPDPRLIVTPSSWAAAEAGREGVEMLLHESPLPTAVFCFNDLTAIGAIAAISVAGLRIPADISVLGFDNNSLAPYTVPALSTIAQPKRLMAERAVQKALRLLTGQPTTEEGLLQCELIVRDSTAPPRAGPP